MKLDQRQYLADFYKIAAIKMAQGKDAEIYERLHLTMSKRHECYINGVYTVTTKGKTFYRRGNDRAQREFDVINADYARAQ